MSLPVTFARTQGVTPVVETGGRLPAVLDA